MHPDNFLPQPAMAGFFVLGPTGRRRRGLLWGWWRASEIWSIARTQLRQHAIYMIGCAENSQHHRNLAGVLIGSKDAIGKSPILLPRNIFQRRRHSILRPRHPESLPVINRSDKLSAASWSFAVARFSRLSQSLRVKKSGLIYQSQVSYERGSGF